MKNRMTLYSVLVLLVSLLLLVGCTEKPKQITEDGNIKTIDVILQKALTGPNEELKKIFHDGDFTENVRQYDNAQFNGYFANDSAYMEFVNSYGAVLMITPIRNDYTLKINNIEYEQTDSEEIIYNFSIDLQYQKEGSQESEVVSVNGQANLNEEHKIEDMLINLKNLWSAIE
ncbi:hypothetical protein SAMN05192533_11753 [Mesobacillus persicus]|jgi:hypothetical protein|uniref:DUF4468 domain-containing protein n=1 Tax=Mesobacillus persicus TaxID=930146 RepID=A0A1H8IIB5_9BACI|nr:hypothetical protein [Mesobacillus persicus]SEN68029.1 hypothetical protein SAMN05192533_11753 [Mesobacillus persicus]